MFRSSSRVPNLHLKRESNIKRKSKQDTLFDMLYPLQVLSTHGDFFSVTEYSGTIITFNPNIIQQMLKDDVKLFSKFETQIDSLYSVFGQDTILRADNENWRYKRELFKPFFSKASLEKYHSQFYKHTEETFADYQNDISQGNEVILSMSDILSTLTIKIVSEALFSYCFDSEEKVNDLQQRISHINYVLGGASSMLSIFLNYFKFKKSLQCLNNSIEDMVYERQSNPGEANCLIDALLADLPSPDDDSYEEANLLIVEDIMTLILVGYDTTSNTLTWVLKFIDDHPELKLAILEEIDNYPLTNQELPFSKWPTLKAVIDEVLRLYPALWQTSRRANESLRLGGFDVDIDQEILVNFMCLHRHPEYWKQPHEFQAERFLNSGSSSIIPNTYLPFGYGPRACMGARFAIREIMTVVGLMMTNFDYKVLNGEKIQAKQGISLMLTEPLKINLTTKI